MKELVFSLKYNDYDCSKENFRCNVVYNHFTIGNINKNLVEQKLKGGLYHSKIGNFYDTSLVNCENTVTKIELLDDTFNLTVQFMDRGNIFDLIDENGVDAFNVEPMFTNEYPIMLGNWTRVKDYHTVWFDGLNINYNKNLVSC
jgi:hypothetical protein